MRLVGKARDGRNLNQRYPRADDLSKSAARPSLGAKCRRGGSVDFGKSARQSFGNNSVRIGPAIETTAWVAYDLVGQQIRPIVDNRRNLPQLRCQDTNRGLRVAFGGSSDGICVGHTPGSKADLRPMQREVHDRRASRLETIQMGVKCVVQQYVARAHAKSARTAAFLIPPGKNDRRIGARVHVSALRGPAVAPLAARGDRSEERHVGSEAQWNCEPGYAARWMSMGARVLCNRLIMQYRAAVFKRRRLDWKLPGRAWPRYSPAWIFDS
jgi:hypothetical protein